MTARIDIIAPATVALLGSLVESADPLALSVTHAAGGVITVTIIAGNVAAHLSASATAGATVANNANTLTISGTQAEVNAALASLEVSDTTADTLYLSITGSGILGAATDIAVSEIPTIGPAFAAPPASFTISPYSITSIPGLVIGDPAAFALDAAGHGQLETMAVTLSVASGVLFLPTYSQFSGITASGIGTANILLNFTADQLPAVNALLAALQWAGPAAISGLAYAARDVSGPLGTNVTSGNIVLDISGTQGPPTTVTTGAGAAILGPTTLSLGSVLDVTAITADIGGVNGQGAVLVAPGAALEVPYNLLSIGGTSYDFGGLSAATLFENGVLIATGGMAFSGPVNLGGADELIFEGSLVAGDADAANGNIDVSIAAGALLTGSGELVAGNFSESGAITGAGTILANPGDTLVIAAGEISGVALQVAAGGVLELGPIDPLYGVFDAIPLSIGSNMTLSFIGDAGAVAASGAFADTLAQTGGVIVINSPALFEGQIVNFAPGDRLIFPGLSGLTLFSISAYGFVVSGTDSSNVTQTYTISAAIPAGATPFAGTDEAGDGEISLRDAQPDVFLGGASISVTALQAQPGTPQPLTGLDILARSWNGQSLSVTLSVSHGMLGGLGIASAEQVTITAASPALLNAQLQTVSYTANANAQNDLLTITSASAALSGLYNILPIALDTTTGTTNDYFGDATQPALFVDNQSEVPVLGAAAPGELVVSAGAAVFDTFLDIPGLSGTALVVENGAVAIFEPGTTLVLGADVSVSGGALLAAEAEQFIVSGNVSIAGTAILTNDITASGSLAVAGTVFSSGSLAAGALNLAAGGFVQQTSGVASFGAVNDAGIFAAFGASELTVGGANILGSLLLGGTASFVTSGTLMLDGTVSVGADADLSALYATQSGGTMMLAGTETFMGALISNAQIDINSGTILSPVVSLQGNAVLAGSGVIGAGLALGTLVSSGTILAEGDLLIADDITLAGGAMIIAGSSALDLAHAVSAGSIAFTGENAVLTINDVSQFSASITGMLAHDAIDLVGAAPSLVTFAAGTVSISDQNGVPVGQFGLAPAAGQPVVSLLSDGAGGTLITLGDDMPCFARATRLLTPNGYRPVESLVPGDPVITFAGDRQAIRWIGWRTLDLPRADRAQPVRFAPDALAPGVPARPVILSPLHAVLVGGVLVPACHLVNGATITQEKRTAITYYHIELDRHDILLADGMPAESYLDTGNRGQLYVERGVRGLAIKPCARLVTGGPELANIRRRLHQTALHAGYRLTYRPVIRGVADGNSVVPDCYNVRGRRDLRFVFPAKAKTLNLVSQTCAPAETDPESEDRRQLGICLVGIPPGVSLASGWFDQSGADAGIWLGEGAELDFGGRFKQSLTLTLTAVAQSWTAPAPTMIQNSRPAHPLRTVDFPATPS